MKIKVTLSTILNVEPKEFDCEAKDLISKISEYAKEDWGFILENDNFTIEKYEELQ